MKDEMKIDETLKNNLIADVENIVSTELRPQTKAALKRCFEITIGHHYASQHKEQPEDFPDIDFRNDIANELSREDLIERICEMNKSYREMREEWFKVVMLKEQPKITNCIHFDPCQGRNKCCNDKVKSNRCIPGCGEIEVKSEITSKYLQDLDDIQMLAGE